MNVHRFAIGQSVRLKGTIGMALQTGDMFRITGRMPARTGRLNIGSATTRDATSALQRKTISKRSPLLPP